VDYCRGESGMRAIELTQSEISENEQHNDDDPYDVENISRHCSTPQLDRFAGPGVLFDNANHLPERAVKFL